MIDTEQIRHSLETWKAIAEREGAMICDDCHFDKEEDEDNEGRCFNVLCEYRWSETCFSNERIGWPCDCGSTIWHKDEYNNKEEVTSA